MKSMILVPDISNAIIVANSFPKPNECMQGFTATVNGMIANFVQEHALPTINGQAKVDSLNTTQ